MSTPSLPDLSTVSIRLRAPVTPAAGTPPAAGATPAAEAAPAMADDGKSVSFDLAAGEAEAIDLDRALDLALAVADGELTGTEARRLGLDRTSLRTLLEATADGRIDGKELAKLAPKQAAAAPAPTGTGAAAEAAPAAAAPAEAAPAPAAPAEAAPAAAAPAEAAPPATHTVKPGDTLSKIAKAYAGDPQRYKELLALNPQIKDPNKIFPGQTITLPASWSQAAPATGTPPAAGTGTAPAPATGTAPAAGTETAPAPATDAAPAGADAAVSARISSEDEAKAMQETQRYLAANFDQVAGADGRISKEDLQANLPDGPGKAAFLKHFDDLKFLSIDPGAEAWTNLTKDDVEELGRTLDWRVGEGGPIDWQLHAEAHQMIHEADADFKAADRDGNGRLEGDEIPADLQGQQSYLGGSALNRVDFSEHRELPRMGVKMDESDARVEAWKRAQAQAPDTAT